MHLNDINKAIESGLAYVTEDRKQYGLILIDDIKRNISLSNLRKLSRRGVINENEEVLVAEEYRRKLNIKTPSILQKTVNLSGGNQQKWCSANGSTRSRISLSWMNLHEALT